MPVNYKKYPSNWKTEIRPSILVRANYCCEFCGANHHAVGFRVNGIFYPSLGNIYLDCAGKGLRYPSLDLLPYAEAIKMADSLNEIQTECKYIVIVLTIAHLDHDTTNNSLMNLKALCQKCHLSHDKDFHKQNARKTFEKKKGILCLPFVSSQNNP